MKGKTDFYHGFTYRYSDLRSLARVLKDLYPSFYYGDYA